ncbi:WhiB family transcriptional regulator [soil metagenome]|jgi:WhiB family redox-sensing transcriptional regulator
MANIAHLPRPIEQNYAWQTQGACRTVDPESFFSPDSERGARRSRREAAAKALCAQCPVVRQCLEYAMQVNEPHGVWGGLSSNERQALQSRVRRATAS